MSEFTNLRQRLFGKPLDPLDTKASRHIALVAFFAWVGLGADGIAASCYGPEEAFRALGEHTDLGLYLALATAATVFIIALAYNQVIELFPTGGGGYRVATRLIGPYAGLTSGAALILDYVLTISISIASGVDALFSLFPLGFQSYKLATEVALIAALVLLNLRGMKEAIAVLLPWARSSTASGGMPGRARLRCLWCSRLKRDCSSLPPTPAFWEVRRCSPTWPPTRGCRTSSATSRRAWSPRTGFSSWGSHRSSSFCGPEVAS